MKAWFHEQSVSLFPKQIRRVSQKWQMLSTQVLKKAKIILSCTKVVWEKLTENIDNHTLMARISEKSKHTGRQAELDQNSASNESINNKPVLLKYTQ